MLLAELLDTPVTTAEGDRLGYVIDLRFLLEPAGRSSMGAARLHGLLVSPRTRTPFLGFERTGARSPWLVAGVLRRLHRGTFLVRWADVVEVGSTRLVLRDGFERWSPLLPEATPQ
jgi:sporulation protein YlmC with PRC-barrel domain